MMHPVVIYGAGGLGSVVLDILRQRADRDVVGFLDSDPARHGTTHDGLPVLGGFDQITRLRWQGVQHVIVAIGDNRTRQRIARRLRDAGMELDSAIHPLARIAPSARLADHAIVAARAIICPHARIAEHVVLGPAAIVEHDNVLEPAVHLEPAVRLAGGVRVGQRARLSIGACVIPGCRIGPDACVGPGAVVIRDVPPNARVAGVPARCEAHAAATP